MIKTHSYVTTSSMATTSPTRHKKTKKEITKIIRKVISVGRAALDIYVAIKRKDPIYTGMSMISTYEALDSLFSHDNENSKIDSFIKRNDLVRKENFGLGTLVENLLKSIGVSKRIILKDDDVTLYSYIVNNIEIFIRSVDVNAELFMKKDQDYIIELQKIVDSFFGDQISLKYDPGKETITASNIKIDFDNYVPIVNPEEYSNIIKKFRQKNIQRSSLLTGKPGSGKTTFCSVVASMIGGRLISIPPNTLTLIVDYGIDLIKVTKLFSPSVILFDDLDRVGPHYMGKFLNIVETLNRSKSNILIMGTVNDINLLPSALKRPGRFDEILEFQYPTSEQRKKIIKNYLNSFGTRLSNSNVNNLVELTEELMPAYIKEIVIQSTILPMDRIPKVIERIKKFQI